MAQQIFIGFIVEGTTDSRFLESVVKRTFDDIAFECTCEIETFLQLIDVDKSGLSFIEFVEKASRIGFEEYSIMVLCVHSDADDKTDAATYRDRIIPAKEYLCKRDQKRYCTLLAPLVPVRMMESWMLADKELLKREIGTNKTDNDLGIDKKPETYQDPKEIINNAIRIAQMDLSKRRRKLSIGELYQTIGQKVSLVELDKLDSYRKFKAEVRDTYRALNYLR